MNPKELQQIKSIASHFIKHQRSKSEILATLKESGILDQRGQILSPYNQIFSYK